MKQLLKPQSAIYPLLLLVLALQILATFLSEVKLIPTLRTNVSWAEVNGLVLFALFAMYSFKHNAPIHGHLLLTILSLWVIAAAFSLVNLWGAGDARIEYSLISVIALGFEVALAWVIFNLLRQREDFVLLSLRIATVVIAVICIWIIQDQRTHPFDLLVAGPFRNRSQMGVYLFSTIWVVLLYASWHAARWWEQLGAIVVVGMMMYAIVSSSRQSIYFVSVVGLVLFGVGFLFVKGRDRIRMFLISAVILALGLSFYFLTGDANPQFANFRSQFNQLNDRLENVLTSSEEISPTEDEDSYFQRIQREGALRAFEEHPLLGIGWNGFYRSPYSPTGHELHSTWFRFPSEMGLVGVILYLIFLAVLFGQALRLFIRARGTRYQVAAYIFLVAFICLTLSHYYNRMFTDRAYWVMFAFFLVVNELALNSEQVAVTPQGEPVAPSGNLGLIPIGRSTAHNIIDATEVS